MAELGYRVVLKRGQQERTKAAACFLRLGQEILFDDLVGDESLKQVIGMIGRQSLCQNQVRSQRRHVAMQQGSQGVAALLTADVTGAGDQ